MFSKIGILKIFAKLTEIRMCHSLFLTKLQFGPSTLLNKDFDIETFTYDSLLILWNYLEDLFGRGFLQQLL